MRIRIVESRPSSVSPGPQDGDRLLIHKGLGQAETRLCQAMSSPICEVRLSYRSPETPLWYELIVSQSRDTTDNLILRNVSSYKVLFLTADTLPPEARWTHQGSRPCSRVETATRRCSRRPVSGTQQSSDNTAQLDSYKHRFFRPDDIYIAVMGMTGSGKSSLIATCCPEAESEIGHALESSKRVCHLAFL